MAKLSLNLNVDKSYWKLNDSFRLYLAEQCQEFSRAVSTIKGKFRVPLLLEKV